jgi:Tfp pilus assembly protein PilN
MRDLEFLPQWHRKLHSRRRALFTQVWATLSLCASAALWLWLANVNIRQNSQTLASLETQSKQLEQEMAQMERLESLLKQFRQQDEVLKQLGVHVESGRLIARLSEVLPDSVSLTNINFDIIEKKAMLTGLQQAALKDPASIPMDRRMTVKVDGVAPSDVELATLLTELSRSPFFENVTPVFSRDMRRNGRIFREFEVSFSIDLNMSVAEAQ